jgi:cyanate permease
MKQGRFSFNGRADDPQSSPFLLGMLVDWTGGFLAGGYFVVALGLGILLMSFMIEKNVSCSPK